MTLKDDIVEALAKKDLGAFTELMKKVDDKIEAGEDGDLVVLRDWAYTEADKKELFLSAIGGVEEATDIVNRAIKSGNLVTMEGAFSAIEASRLDAERLLSEKIIGGTVTDDDIAETDAVLEKLRRLEDLLGKEIVKVETVKKIPSDARIRTWLDRKPAPVACTVCGRTVDKAKGIFHDGKWYHEACFDAREKRKPHIEYCSICGEVISSDEMLSYLPTGDAVHKVCREDRGI